MYNCEMLAQLISEIPVQLTALYIDLIIRFYNMHIYFDWYI